MKFRSSFVVALLAFSLTTLCAQADEAQPPNYMLFAIKTDLQRELLNTTRADAYLQFDVDECLHHGKFEWKRFDQEGFQKTLAALARQIGKPEPRLVVGYRYSSGFPNPDETEAMQQAVQNSAAGAQQSAAASQEMHAQADTMARITGELRTMVGHGVQAAA